MKKPPPETPDFDTTPFVTRTRGIVISVVPLYDQARSKPTAGAYIYGYHVDISNEGKETVQLISRHWIIRDGFGETEHVAGEGVVGHQPVLEPGMRFRYASFCPLKTPTGTMEGTYRMLRQGTTDSFDAVIGRFDLKNPDLMN